MKLTDNELRECLADFETRISRLENMIPYQNEPLKPPEIIHLPGYDEVSRKLAQEARIIANDARDTIKKHISYTDKKKKSYKYD